MTEDFIFGDLGVINFWMHVPWTTMISVVSLQGYAVNFYYNGEGAMRWGGDILKSITSLMCPLIYPTVILTKPLERQIDHIVLLFANGVFIFATAYYQSLWIESLKKTNKSVQIAK